MNLGGDNLVEAMQGYRENVLASIELSEDGEKDNSYLLGKLDACDDLIYMLRVADTVTVVLKDENETTEPLEMIVRQCSYGICMESTKAEDLRGVMVDYFSGNVSVKVWTNPNDEDYTHSIDMGDWLKKENDD